MATVRGRFRRTGSKRTGSKHRGECVAIHTKGLTRCDAKMINSGASCGGIRRRWKTSSILAKHGIFKSRRRGERLPAFTWAQRRFLYGEACSLGAQVERLLSMAPSDQVLTLILDDVRADPRREYLRVLDFLRVPDDGRLDFSIHNAAKTLRVPMLRYLYLLVALKRAARIERNSGLWTRIQMANQIGQPRTRLSSEMMDVLRTYFGSDVERLGLLLRRDLSGWLA